VRSLSVLGAALRCGRLSAAKPSALDELGEQLADWGKVIRLQTRGRTSGRPIEVALGYVEEPDGAVLVAAGGDAAWARTLDADPRCRMRLGDAAWADAVADPLDGPEQARAVRELILKYGTPAERLGRGPAFRLRPVAP
jgi:deazaflavin-dependent oxidoreductase (nitroreductase family)